MESPKLGELITDPNQGRDAIHIAVMPMIATKIMHPGQRLASGIVDPFLTDTVPPGQRFWLFLYPNTVTDMRHVWKHPAFRDEPARTETKPRRSEADVWAEQEAK